MPAADENVTSVPGGPHPTSGRALDPATRLAESQYEFKPQREQGDRRARQEDALCRAVSAGAWACSSSASASESTRRTSHLTRVRFSRGRSPAWSGSGPSGRACRSSIVVRTEGRDISHLIDALDDLRKLYSLQFWLLILAADAGVDGSPVSWLAWLGDIGEAGF